MITKQELAEIKERCEKATEGTWENFDGTSFEETNVVYEYDDLTETDCGVIAECGREEDAEFIAHARQDIPRLVSEIERLKSEIKFAIHESKYGDAENAIERVNEILGRTIK